MRIKPSTKALLDYFCGIAAVVASFAVGYFAKNADSFGWVNGPLCVADIAGAIQLAYTGIAEINGWERAK